MDKEGKKIISFFIILFLISILLSPFSTTSSKEKEKNRKCYESCEIREEGYGGLIDDIAFLTSNPGSGKITLNPSRVYGGENGKRGEDIQIIGEGLPPNIEVSIAFQTPSQLGNDTVYPDNPRPLDLRDKWSQNIFFPTNETGHLTAGLYIEEWWISGPAPHWPETGTYRLIVYDADESVSVEWPPGSGNMHFHMVVHGEAYFEVYRGEPPSKPINPEIELDPDRGPPETEVLVIGRAFPPNVDVEIRWDAEDGELLTTTMSDGEGNFTTTITVPKNATEGEHTVYAGYPQSSETPQVAGSLQLQPQFLKAGAVVSPVSNSVGPTRIYVTATFTVEIWCVYGNVKARLRGGLPLEGVEVALTWYNPIIGGLVPIPDVITGQAFAITDEYGRYRICNPLITVPMPGSLLLTVTLREHQAGVLPPTNPIYTLLDASANNNIVQAGFGRNSEIGADPTDFDTWFTIEATGDLEKNLWFENRDDISYTVSVREDHALDAALIYYHTHQAMRVYRALGAPFTRRPVNIHIYADRTRCLGQRIEISEEHSEWNDGNAPKNREWHEFSHYVMWDIYGGRFPPRHYEILPPSTGDINGNRFIDKDVNHGGYWGNTLSSSDAVTEGFAEFMAVVIADQMNQQREIYMQDHVEPYIYTVGSPIPEMINYEINQPQTIVQGLPAETRRTLFDLFKSGTKFYIQDEENCVASTLWDIYDGIDDGDRDHIQLPIETIWQILTQAYTFPAYYDGNLVGTPAIRFFTGDPFTYKGSWVWRNIETGTGSYNGTSSLRVPWPTMNRHIWYIRDIYDAFTWSLPDKTKQIDEVFFSHRIYMDTFHKYEDYTTLGMGDVSTFRDPASKIDVTISPEAAYEFWGKGLVVDVNVSGWGAGFTIDKHPAFDARGYLYMWIWVNAPEGTTFDVVVEDYNGQWLCSGTSEAVIDVTETPLDMSRVQRGTGSWGAYSPPYASGGPYPFVVVLAPSAADEQYKFVYDFRPNPNHETPQSGSSGPDIRMIDGIGVMFTTPGTYRAMVGAVVLNLDYPWKPGMRSIKGIGDPAIGRWMPYRRDHPPLNGSKALIHVGEAPTTLKVSMNYAPPYEDLSFTYPINITEKSQEIWLYIEPPLEGGENTITIVAEREGTTSQPHTLNSTQYWNNIVDVLQGKKEHVAEANLQLTPKPDLSWLLVVAVILVLVTSVTIAVVVILRRRSKGEEVWRTPPPSIEPTPVTPVPKPTASATKPQYCMRCGAKLIPPAKFCRECGARIG